ncbi:MAG: threonine aldolase [Clostridia bacterium]|nr:threonine aldolase [Clostridia bacterium]
MATRDFRGEVWTNVHPEVFAAMAEINGEPVDGGCGEDSHSKRATQLVQKYFKDEIYTTYTISGTAANIIALKCMLDSWSAVLCAEQAHINNYECGALEFNLGNKILATETPDGKLTPEILDRLILKHKKYKYLPKVVAITQPTEFGTLYSVEELKTLCSYAHAKGMYVYIDGARIASALSALNVSLTEMIEYTDVDAFTVGGTKAGAMFGEMVVLRRKEFAANLAYVQKQSMQHLDKSKFLGVQLEYLLESGLWLKNAEKSNAAAKLLEKKLKEKGVKIYYPVETNMVFCVLDEKTLEKITAVFDLHYWDVFENVVRIATTYLTDEKAIDRLVSLI